VLPLAVSSVSLPPNRTNGAVEPAGRLRVRLGGAEAVLLDLGATAVTGLGGRSGR